ncbi:hypothetical protein [Bradyrhizobium sp. NP1]|uniref:hypothetical protein n=1 Tax=Bradyrhizobium sp. NP1 TaxID=3049772 RepID=UPI0025A57234|nr:hypothetical protein [Bradyrhizobium sp. NP1]WJR76468.1 hypothetical protein QOU61_27445 [Bradyrhizobium sp. NP1]
MSDDVFYVGAINGNGQFTGYVPARFLMREGMYVTDPTPGGSQQAYLYSDGLGNNKTDGKAANPNNYLVVPANYTEEQARNFAAKVSDTWYGVYPGDETGTHGPNQALMSMADAFAQGGPQDLQRHPQWGVPKGSVVPAFVGSASNHLGYVTGLTPIPMALSEVGGGAANLFHYLRGDPNIDVGGPYWLSRQNHANIAQGFAAGLAARRPPAPFIDDGYGSGQQPAADQIGDGNGTASFAGSLAGVNSDEPTPPTWPPQSKAPIRYLSSRVVRY